MALNCKNHCGLSVAQDRLNQVLYKTDTKLGIESILAGVIVGVALGILNDKNLFKRPVPMMTTHLVTYAFIGATLAISASLFFKFLNRKMLKRTDEFSPISFNDEEQFMKFLTKFPAIKPETWIKSASSLFNEIKTGECLFGLENGNLLRRVEVVCVKCYYTNEEGERFQLIEEKQVFNDGTIRQRGYKFVAEKLQKNESPEQGAFRGLSEELQISNSDICLKALHEEGKTERRESETYSGISCCYKTNVFSCEFPKHLVKPTFVEVQADKKTFFIWEKI